MRGVLVLILASLLLSGCFGSDGKKDQPDDTPAPTITPPNNNTTTPPPSTPPPPGNETQENNTTLAPSPFSLGATSCTELLGFFSIPLAQAQAFVPSGYAILGASSGKATVISGLKECGDVAINGTSIGAASTVDVGVLLESPDPGVFHYYQTWWYTDNSAYWARLAAMGWHGGVSNDTMTGAAALPPATVTVDVAGPFSNYTMAGTMASGAPGGTNNAVGWYDGPLGTVTITKELVGTELGTGSVDLEAEGEMVALVGATGNGPALWNVYDMTGTVAFTDA